MEVILGLALDVGYASLLTAAAPFLALRAARTGRYREGWQQRLLGRVPVLPANKTSIWLHGVSLGEVQLLKPLVEYFTKTQLHRDRQVVLSTSTLTGMQVARKSMPQTLAFYCPLDFSWAVQQALRRTRPELIVLGELEVWPHLIGLASRQGIPVAVVNGRLSDRSFRGYKRFRSLVHSTFSHLSLVAAQDQATADRFCELGVPQDRVHVTGSLKFDNVNADREHAEVISRAKLLGLTGNERIVVAGSTQDPEEAAAIKAVEQLLPKYPNLKLIVVPRHPERFEEVHQLLRHSSLKTLRLSTLRTHEDTNTVAATVAATARLQSTTDSVAATARLQNPALNAGAIGFAHGAWQALLVDSVGELKWWWGLAELAIVGGSFGSRGGQNMLEPSAYGAKVAFGPNTSNFRQIVNQLLLNEAAWQLPNVDAIEPWLDQHLADPALGQGHAQRARELIHTHQGATGRTCKLLDSLLRDVG